MAYTLKTGDTWPPLFGLVTDDAGTVALGTADHAILLAKSGTVLIEGTVTIAGTTAPDGSTANWLYTWASGDTATAGTYDVELEIHWDDGATPPKVETVPNTGTESLIIEADVGDASGG